MGNRHQAKKVLVFSYGDKMAKYTIQQEVRTTSDGSEPTDLKINILPDNLMVCLQNVCVGNMNSNGTYVHVGVIIGGSINWLTMIECTSDKKYYSWNATLYFRTVKTIILRFNNVNDGDVLEGYVYGYYLD